MLFRTCVWAILASSALLLATPMTLSAQLDCSISGEGWSDIRLFRRCLARPGFQGWRDNDIGRTVLHTAALETDNPTIIVLLLEAGANPNARDDDGYSPLGLAAFNGNPMVTSHLLGAGADPNAANNEGTTPLHGAVRNVRITQLLLEAGADPNAVKNNGYGALHSAVERNLQAAQLLLEAGADPNATGNDGSTPLHYAARNADPMATSILIEAGVDPNAKLNNGTTPLHVAAGAANLEAAGLLLEAGADVRAYNAERLTPLHLAINSGSHDLVSALILSGASESLTPLQRAVVAGDAAALATLLVQGSDPSAVDHSGWTAMHFSVHIADVGITDALLAAGADTEARNGDGMTPLDNAVLYGGSLSLIQILLAAGADAGTAFAPKDNDGHSPLHHAAMTRDPSVLTVLLDAGASLMVQDGAGNTALHIAARSNPDPEVICVLLDAGANAAAMNHDGQRAEDLLNFSIQDTDCAWRLKLPRSQDPPSGPRPQPGGRVNREGEQTSQRATGRSARTAHVDLWTRAPLALMDPRTSCQPFCGSHRIDEVVASRTEPARKC